MNGVKRRADKGGGKGGKENAGPLDDLNEKLAACFGISERAASEAVRCNQSLIDAFVADDDRESLVWALQADDDGEFSRREVEQLCVVDLWNSVPPGKLLVVSKSKIDGAISCTASEMHPKLLPMLQAFTSNLLPPRAADPAAPPESPADWSLRALREFEGLVEVAAETESESSSATGGRPLLAPPSAEDWESLQREETRSLHRLALASPERTQRFGALLSAWSETLTALLDGEREDVAAGGGVEAVKKAGRGNRGAEGVSGPSSNAMSSPANPPNPAISATLASEKLRQARRLARLSRAQDEANSPLARLVAGVVSAAKLEPGAGAWRAALARLEEALYAAQDGARALAALERALADFSAGSLERAARGAPRLAEAVALGAQLSREYREPGCAGLLVQCACAAALDMVQQTLERGGAWGDKGGVGSEADEQNPSVAEKSESAPVLVFMRPAELSQAAEQVLALQQALSAAFAARKLDVVPAPALNGQPPMATLQLLQARAQALAQLALHGQRLQGLLAQRGVLGLATWASALSAALAGLARACPAPLAAPAGAWDAALGECLRQAARAEQGAREAVQAALAQAPSAREVLRLSAGLRCWPALEGACGRAEEAATQAFQMWAVDLRALQKHYERGRENPPAPQHLSAAVGRIAWLRNLRRRLEAPMRLFKDHPAVVNAKEHRRIVKTYHALVGSLAAGEVQCHNAWVKSLDAWDAALREPLLLWLEDEKAKEEASREEVHAVGTLAIAKAPLPVRVPAVALDRRVLQAAHEARHMARMGLTVPARVETFVLVAARSASLYRRLEAAVASWVALERSAREAPLGALLLPWLADVRAAARPGFDALVWTSLNVDGFLHRMEHLVGRAVMAWDSVCAIVARRIDGAAALVAGTCLFDFAEIDGCPAARLCDVLAIQIARRLAELEKRRDDVFLASREAALVAGGWTLNAQEGSDEESVGRREAGQQATSGTLPASASRLLESHCSQKLSEAFAAALVRSVQQLAASLGAPRGRGLLSQESGLAGPSARLGLDLALAHPGVSAHPPIPEVCAVLRATLEQAARQVAAASEMPGDHEGLAETSSPEKQLPASVQAALAAEMAGIQRMLEAQQRCVAQHCASFEIFGRLWHSSAEADAEQSARGNVLAELRGADARFQELSTLEQELSMRPRFVPCEAAFELDTQALLETLALELESWKRAYGANLHASAAAGLQELEREMAGMNSSLEHELEDLADVRLLLGVLDACRALQSNFDCRVTPIEDKYLLLQRHGFPLPKDELDAIADVRSLWQKIALKAETVQDKLAQAKNGFMETLKSDVQTFLLDAASLCHDWQCNGPMEPNITPQEALARLRRFQKQYETQDQQRQVCAADEELFGVPPTSFEAFLAVGAQMQSLDALYSLFAEVVTTFAEYGHLSWSEVGPRLEEMTTRSSIFHAAAARLPKTLREWPAYLECRRTVDDFQDALPLIQGFVHASIQRRHWAQLVDCVQPVVPLPAPGAGLTLRQFLDAGPLLHRDEVLDICAAALKEEQMQLKFDALVAQWSSEAFDFVPHKQRGAVVLHPAGTSEMLEKLEESLMTLASMSSSRAAAAIIQDIHLWTNKLSTINDVVEQWLLVQNMWMYMEAVFSGGDIMRQLPQEAKRFQLIDRNFMKVVAHAQEQVTCVATCVGADVLQQLLPPLLVQLELCQKSLSAYLDAKRSEFPRFNFVSDSTLLEILSLGTDPTAVIPHFQSGLFDAISNVTFDKNNPTQIVEMHSREGEIVPMATPVDTKGNVEVWLQKLVLGMQESVHHQVRKAAQDVMEQDLARFVFSHPAQAALLGLQLKWTAETQAALRASSKEKNAMTRALRSAEATLRELVTLTLRQDLTPIQRTSLETCITVQLHLKETVEDLVRKKIHDVVDFEWLKHARFYWHQDLNTVVISICDVDFEYSYEYLGVKERLVITPLTDVCYITLSQALGMFMGGAPAGPAGTGKTETTKDLGNTLGKYVVVFNCSNQMDNKAMGKIFKGLAQSGLWGCFDEFNRINLDVLSVCAQQLHCILTALRERKKSFVFTDGSTVSLDLRAGYFITMNPGYAGRQELPENLKALFRGVTMMVPDRQIIMKVKLAACGYQESDTLARKFYTLYMLCEQQLSKQAHYDFGLRNILSVLRTAGASKRASPERSETQLLMRTLRDLNMSKLVADDLPIFLGLVEDVFPSQKVERASFLTLQEALLQVIKERGLQAHPTWLDKCVQLYEVNAVRHGIMVVGPSCTGKSTMIACLAAALTLLGTKTVVWKMNPKATTAAQMFGRLDTATGDWTDGVFSTLWRRAARARNQSTWIVLDGPVDALWIENLNTVLDDNRVLTLANGDRIPMTPNMKLFFEVENLHNASPATVSRAGIVYVSASDLGWKPVADSWLQTQLPNVDAGLRPLFAQHVENLLQFVALQTKPMMRTEAVCLVRTMLVLLSGLLPRAEDASPRGGMRIRPGDGATQSTARPILAPTPRLGSSHLEKVFAFALAWSVGGLLDEQDRPRFHAELDKRNLPVPSAAPPSKRGLDRPVPSAHSSRAAVLPPLKPPAPSTSLTIYDCMVSERGEWLPWADLVPDWTYPREHGDLPLDLSTLSLPTVDSVRYAHLVALAHRAGCPALLVGNPGTAKTWMVKQYLAEGSRTLRASPAPAQRTLTLSHLTSPGILQTALEGSLEKQQGRNYGPPGGGCMTIFFDDLAQPAVNEWGDQVTNELVRQILEQQGFYSLAKPIGDMKMLVDIQYVAAIRTPGVGWNDIPNRLKGRFAAFGVAPPSTATMNAIFGRLLAGRFGPEGDGLSPLSRVSRSLVPATVSVWREAQAKLQPGPSKPHYAFSLHDLARLFQGVVQADLKSLRELKELEPAGEQQAAPPGRPQTASARALEGAIPAADLALLGSARARTPREASSAPGNSARSSQARAPESGARPPASQAALGGAASLLALWRHECLRVFGDKLVSEEDKAWLREAVQASLDEHCDAEQVQAARPAFELCFVDFLREPPTDEVTGEVCGPKPSVYELARGGLAQVRAAVQRHVAEAAGQRGARAAREMQELVLFRDAVEHLVRLSRVLAQPRGCALLVGVGGSGKRSLARLACSLVRMQVFGVSLTKTYNVGSFLEDLRALIRTLVLQQKPVCFLLAESDIRDEAFFEYLNQLLVTGEIPGLFPRDEMEQILGDLQPIMQAARPGVPDSWRARHQFFVESVRRRLHLVLCLSSAGTRLARVQQRFPGLVAGCTIDWYLPWPDDALTSVADFLLRDADLRADDQGRARVCRLLARAQLCAVQAAHRYRAETRRSVHITPAHFFSFVDSFKGLYVSKLEGKVRLAGTLRGGLQKMSDAKDDVAAMAKTLKLTSLDLEKAAKEVETLLQEITRSTALAEKEKHKVAVIVSSVTSKSEHIAMVKQDAERDLQEARPALESAVAALNSITPKDINSLKSLKNPPNIVKRIFDCVLLLRHFPLNPVVWEEFKNQKVLKGSYEEAVKMMGDLTFMQALVNFPKEGINDETVELIQPYFEAPDFNYESAKKASGNVAGLCNWADAMCKYHAVAKMVEPKIAALRQAEIEFRGATRERLQAESEFKVVQGRLDDMQREFESALSQKQTLERDLNAAQARLAASSALLAALAGEETRWTAQLASIDGSVRNLAGDCSLAASFTVYLGPFNRAARASLQSALRAAAADVGVPCSPELDPAGFLAEDTEQGRWATEGLPTDELSLQNGVLVTRAVRAPFLLDPQGQALAWLRVREAANGACVGQQSARRFRSLLAECAVEGRSLLVENADEDLDPVLDGVLQLDFGRMRAECEEEEGGRGEGSPGQVATRDEGSSSSAKLRASAPPPPAPKHARRTARSVQIGDREVLVHPRFRLFLLSRAASPTLPPELCARTSVVDFTVNAAGLEEQLLARLVAAERAELEAQRRRLAAEVHAYRARMAQLEDDLLQRLSRASGNLLDDAELVDILAQTKATTAEVAEKLALASETRRRGQLACEDYRPVASRGTALFFLVAAMQAMDGMYQTSLAQFAALYDRAIAQAEPSPVPARRAQHVADALLRLVFADALRGLYVRHRSAFSLALALQVAVERRQVERQELELFLSPALGAGGEGSEEESKGSGKGSDKEAEKDGKGTEKNGPDADPKARRRVAAPGAWLPAPAQAAVQSLATLKALADLPASLARHESAWRAWHSSEAPEAASLPDLEDRLSPFQRLVLVWALRRDRGLLAAARWLGAALGADYADPTPPTLEDAERDGAPGVPVVCLLSPGTDPTRAIEDLGRRARVRTLAVSMGQGQEAAARRALAQARQEGHWVLLQNAHLSPGYMAEVEALLAGLGAEEGGGEARTGPSAAPAPEPDQHRAEEGGGEARTGPSAAPALAPPAAPHSSSTPVATHPSFRLWLTTQPDDAFPRALLQAGRRLVLEPPAGLRAGLRASWARLGQDVLDAVEGGTWQSLVYVTAYMHSLLVERARFGPAGWTTSYDFTHADLAASLHCLQNHVLDREAAQAKGPAWNTLRFMVGSIQYGGRVTDEADRAVLEASAARLFQPGALARGWSLWTAMSGLSEALALPSTKLPGSAANALAAASNLANSADQNPTAPIPAPYQVPQSGDVAAVRAAVEALPAEDRPELWGMHASAQLSCRAARADECMAHLRALWALLPQAGRAGGESRSERETPDKPPGEKPSGKPQSRRATPASSDLPHPRALPQSDGALCLALAARLPALLPEEEISVRLRRAAGGPSAPLSVVLRQETARLRRALSEARDALCALAAAAAGETAAGPGHETALAAVVLGAVPEGWAARSWPAASLAAWLHTAGARAAQLSRWLLEGRPRSFWLGGFAQPHAFLTAARQEAARKHGPERWAADDVVLALEITRGEPLPPGPDAQLAAAGGADAGVLVHGLWLEGAAFSRRAEALCDPEPLQTHAPLPPVRVGAAPGRAEGRTGCVEVPLYVNQRRGPGERVGSLPIKTMEEPSKWILRGVAVLCTRV